MENIKELEKKVIKRYYGESGLVDLLIGIVSILVFLGIYYKVTYFGAIAVLGILLLSKHLRKAIILPRLGFAEFNLLNSQKAKLRLTLILSAFTAIGIVYFFLASRMGAAMAEQHNRVLILMTIWVMVIGLAVYKIVIMRIYHLFIYCFAMLAIAIRGIILELPDTLLWGSLFMCLLGITIGLPKVLSFMKRYPILENDDE
ncbi:MAG: hypothetical protein K9N06_12160 [Candidatus Cloacimonetes bacterium]|nr:hypothetical protein [Candidatus Cloacimonadota bacterium]